jgi:lipoteichoic acid synthase
MNFYKKIYTFVAGSVKKFLKDYLWISTFVCILIKTLMFIGMIFSNNFQEVNFIKALKIIPILTAYICFILLILSFLFLFKARMKFLLTVFINIAITVLMIADLWNFRAFGSFVTMHSLSQMGNLDNLGSTILSYMHIVDVLYFLDILLISIVFMVFEKKLAIIKNSKRNILAFVLVFIFSISALGFLHYMVDIRKSSRFKTKYLFLNCWTPRQTMQNLSPIGYHIFDAYVYWKDCQPVRLSQQEKDDIKKWYSDKKENLPDNEYKGLFKGKNVIFIETESLENFVINQKISGQEITPNINRLLKNSLYFPNFYAQVHGGTSSDAMLLSNTSVYPIRRGTTFFRFPYTTYNSLPKLLEGIGYSTIAAEPDRGSYWNWMEALKSFGFDKCLDVSNFNASEKIGMGLSDGSFLGQLAPITLQQKNPFYLFMVTQTTHTPYDLPKQYRELNIPESINKTKLGGYFQSLKYTDKHIGIYLSNLDKEGLLDNTVVVIFGDHEGVHKFYPTEIAGVQPSESWWSNNGQVPFIIYSKGLEGKKIETIGGEIDILPTISYLMGVDEAKYIDTAMGRNLLKTNKSFAALSPWKYVGSEKDKASAIEGITIADKIITSDYFKK